VIKRLALVVSVGSLIACGGGSSDSPPPPVAPAPTTDPGTGTQPPAATPPGSTTPPGDTPWTPPTVATTSAGCGKAVNQLAGANFTTPSGRTFHVYAPTGYDMNKTYPVVFAFHGIESSGTEFQGWFHEENFVSKEAIVVYPDAANNGYWDVGGTSDLDMFDEMNKQVGDNYCTNPSKVLAFGFSWGAFFANYLGCKRAGYVRAVMAGEGGITNLSKCGRLPVLVVNRTADVNNEPVSHGKAAAARLVQLDVCGDATSSDGAMNCTTHTSCENPGGTVTFCEDTSSLSDIPGYDPSWDHTVTDGYKQYAWDWFKSLP